MKVEVVGLRHAYGRGREGGAARVALDVARLSVASGARVCLVGSSGSGKTTLLNILCGVLVPSAGRVLLDGVDLFSLDEGRRDALRSQRIGCVFQSFNLLPGLTALENLTLAQRLAGIGARRARERAGELLELLGLSERASARVPELSVGEQQRLSIARAVSKSPRLILADEPTASLDDDSARAALDLLFDTCQGGTLIVATHDARAKARFEAVTALAGLTEQG